MSATTLCVVIPYYQRDTGILRRAISSILVQKIKLRIKLKVIVVDDDSPASAETETEGLDCPNHVEIQIVKQENGGPAAARNAALDRVPADTKYVAFLDSDDTWSPDHIQNALEALGDDYDFYFSDHLQLGAEVSAFERAGRIRPNEHSFIRGSAYLHRYKGDMIQQIIMGNIIGTSTVVYRFDTFSRLRFDERFRNAGEDYLFWLEICGLTRRIAFSEKVECEYGRGINIFAGAQWGSNEAVARLRYLTMYKKELLRRYGKDAELRQAILGSLRGLRQQFAAQLLHRMKDRPLSNFTGLWEQWRCDPIGALVLPGNIARLAIRRLSSK